MDLLASSLTAALFAERRVLARRGWVGENSGLFAHPIWLASSHTSISETATEIGMSFPTAC